MGGDDVLPYKIANLNNAIKEITDRNRKGYKKCNDACITFLMIFKYTNVFDKIGKDIIRIIVNMVLETKATIIWI